MSDYKETVNSLREHADLIETSIELYGPSATRLLVYDLRNAAAAIDALQARLGEAENSVERWKDMYLTKHEPKLGKWIGKSDDDSLVKCSVCGHIRIGSSLWYCKQYVPYCENCGAKMEVQDG